MRLRPHRLKVRGDSWNLGALASQVGGQYIDVAKREIVNRLNQLMLSLVYLWWQTISPTGYFPETERSESDTSNPLSQELKIDSNHLI